MSILTRQQLRDYWNTNINTNASQSITGQKQNVGGIDIIDSMAMGTDIPGEYTPILGFSGSNITAEGGWNRYAIIWTGVANGTLTLPETSTEAIPAGYKFTFLNSTLDKVIRLQTQGTDELEIAGTTYISAGATCSVFKAASGSPSKWYAAIAQRATQSFGAMGTSTGASVAVLANTWTEVPFTPVLGALHNVVQTGEGLEFAVPNHGTNEVWANATLQASIELPSASSTLDLAVGINGAVSAEAELIAQQASNGGAQTTGLFWPFSASLTGIVNNGDVVSMFIRYTTADTVQINNHNITVNGECLIAKPTIVDA